MAGQRFGKWTVIKCTGRDKHRQVTWLCRCGCGKEAVVSGGSLRSSHSRGCRSCAKTTHGGTGTGLHSVWNGLRRRCHDKNCHNYKNYGGRGIMVCPEWNAFGAFRDWALANGYKPSLQIDRINNDGNYDPSNCRFATSKQQNRNRRDNHLVTINGVKRTIAEWAEGAGIKYHTLRMRVNRGWREERLLAPLREEA